MGQPVWSVARHKSAIKFAARPYDRRDARCSEPVTEPPASRQSPTTFAIMPGDDEILGKLGVVTHPIRAGRPGEIVVHIRGGTETYMAYSDEDLPEKSEVLVVAKRSNRTVEVTAFPG